MTRDVRTGVFGELGCKAPCKVFTTANITLEGEQTINGVAVIEDDIVGVKDQVDTTENGVYICSTGEWQRAVWFDDELDVVPGTLVSSYEGNTAPQAIYMVQCDDNPIQFGTSEINFVLKVKGTSTGDKSVTLTGPVTGTSNESSPGVLTVATTIANDAVTTAKILDNNVTNAKLAQVSTATFKGRTTAGTGNAEDLTATQATALLNTFIGDSGAGGVKGLVPSPTTGDAAKFLKGDGTWATSAVPDASATVKGISTLSSQITIGNNPADSINDIDFSGGNFIFDDGSGEASVAAMTKKIDAPFAAGNNQGGLDTGTVSPYTAYYLFAIHNPSTLASDYLFSASRTSPTLPTGYTKKKRIAALWRNASSIANGTYSFNPDGSYIFNFYAEESTSLTSSSTSAIPVSVATPINVNGIFCGYTEITGTPGATSSHVVRFFETNNSANISVSTNGQIVATRLA